MSATADFLVEIGTEELPPKSLGALERALPGIYGRRCAAGLGYTTLLIRHPR
jgi:glycyl-tRNA synthetase beta subunit